MDVKDAIKKALSDDDRETACRLFSDIEDEAEFAEALEMFPHLINYDRKGGWVGTVSNENGWTP